MAETHLLQNPIQYDRIELIKLENAALLLDDLATNGLLILKVDGGILIFCDSAMVKI